MVFFVAPQVDGSQINLEMPNSQSCFVAFIRMMMMHKVCLMVVVFLMEQFPCLIQASLDRTLTPKEDLRLEHLSV